LILSDVFGEDGQVLSVIAKHEQEHEEKVAREKEQKRGKVMEEKSAQLVGKQHMPTLAAGGKPRVPLAAARLKN